MKCKFCGKQNSLSLREINSQWFIECNNCMKKVSQFLIQPLLREHGLKRNKQLPNSGKSEEYYEHY